MVERVPLKRWEECFLLRFSDAYPSGEKGGNCQRVNTSADKTTRVGMSGQKDPSGFGGYLVLKRRSESSPQLNLIYNLCAFPSTASVRFSDRHTLCAFPCYGLCMNDLPPCPTTEELADHLTAPPGSKDRFGVNGTGVLVTAGLVAAADAFWEKETIGTFQKNLDLHPKVWDKLVAINKDQRLPPLQKDLPASYTALYALVVMKDEELKAAEAEGGIKSSASSRSILDWTKAYRLKGSGIEQEMPLTLVLKDDLTAERQQDLLDALKEVALQYGAEVREGKGGLKQAEVKAGARKAVADRIEEELIRLLGPVMLSAPDDLKQKFQVRSATDLIEGPRTTFTGFFQNLVGKVDGLFWREHGRSYCLKIARDFNLTQSRTDRFQLKDRLKKAVEKWDPIITGFGSMVEEIQSTYMK